MKFSLTKAPVRQVGSELVLHDVFTDSKASMDFVIAELNGNHPMITNYVSDRIYFILEGKGEVYSDGHWDCVTEGDCVYIKKNTVHSIKGKIKYAIITSPPFDPKNEISY